MIFVIISYSYSLSINVCKWEIASALMSDLVVSYISGCFIRNSPATYISCVPYCYHYTYKNKGIEYSSKESQVDATFYNANCYCFSEIKFCKTDYIFLFWCVHAKTMVLLLKGIRGSSFWSCFEWPWTGEYMLPQSSSSSIFIKLYHFTEQEKS